MSGPMTVEEQLADISKGMNPLERRNRDVENLYQQFENTIDKPTYMPLSQFRRYEPLFNVATREKAINRTLTEAETEELSDLSAEFYQLVNVQKPIHIVDDYTGKDVMPPLPPIFCRLNVLNGGVSKAMDAFHTACVTDDNGPLSAIHLAKAGYELNQSLIAAQNVEDIKKQTEEATRLAVNFQKAMNGEPENTASEVVKEAPVEVPSSAPQEAIPETPDDLFDFVPDEEE